jgi:drug/metabolite transporter (DMT)-like permease
MNPARVRAYIQLLIVSVIWGVAGVVIKYTLGGFTTPVFLTYRFLISTIVAIPFFILGISKFPKNPKILWLTIFNGFLGTTASLLLLFWGAERTTSIDLNLISAIAPITIVVAGVFFLKEHVTRRETIGILIALAGTLIAVIEPALKTNDGLSGLIGNILVFGSVLIGTANVILEKVILRKEVEALASTHISFMVGFATTLPVLLFSQSPANILHTIYTTPFPYHLGVFYMAILSGTLGYYLWFKAIKSIETSEAGLFAYLYPIFGIPLSILWLKEKITPPFIIGSVIIAIGVFLAEFKKKRYNS